MVPEAIPFIIAVASPTPWSARPCELLEGLRASMPSRAFPTWPLAAASPAMSLAASLEVLASSNTITGFLALKYNSAILRDESLGAEFSRDALKASKPSALGAPDILCITAWAISIRNERSFLT